MSAYTCSRCGTHNTEGNFCGSCGAPRPAATPAPAPAPTPSATPSWQPQAAASQPSWPAPGAAQTPPMSMPAPPMGAPQGAMPSATPPPPMAAPYGGMPAPPMAAPQGMPAMQGQPYGAPQGQWQQPGWQQAPAKKSSAGKIILGIILGIVGLLVVAFGVLVWVGSTMSPFTAVGQGKMEQKGEFVAAYGSFIATGGGAMGDKARLYEMDEAGNLQPVLEVIDDGLLNVTIGDMTNTGIPWMIATYRDRVWFGNGATGDSTPLDITKMQQTLVGDFNGDGTEEAVFFYEEVDGKYTLEALQFDAQGTSKPIYKLTGHPAPFPVLFRSHVNLDGRDLLLSYTSDGEVAAQLYELDGGNGLKLFGSYPLKANAGWLAAGPTPEGGALFVSYDGAEPLIDVFLLNADGLTKYQTITPEVAGRHALLPNIFSGENLQLMTIDMDGNYTLYDME